MKAYFKALIMVFWMIAMISVGNSTAGPPKNTTPLVTVNIAKQALQVVPAANVIATAIQSKVDVFQKSSLQEKRSCFYCTALQSDNSFTRLSTERIYERDVSRSSSKTDIIPRCRSSDLV